MLQSIGKISKELDVHSQTLRKLCRSGKITSHKTSGGHRRFDINEVKKELLNINSYINKDKNKKTILYARVSSNGQKKDLEYQKEKLELYAVAKGYTFEVIEDIGSGLNYNKKGLKKLINLIENDKVDKVVVNYKDRLIRFGYELIEMICNNHNCEIEIINETESKTFENELVEDLISLVTVFSAKLYGSRSHKNKNLIDKVKKEIQD